MSSTSAFGLSQRRTASNVLEKLQADRRKYVEVTSAMAGRVPEKYRPYAAKLSIPASYVILFFAVLGPLYVKLITKLYAVYLVLPHNVINAIIGFGLCFFGGQFPTLVAAIEAFKLSGWDATRPHFIELWEQQKKVRTANKIDDLKDEDNNNIADVHELSGDQLILRKTKLIAKVADPVKFNTAMGGVYTAFLGVLAALKIKFAKAAMLSVAVANMLKKPVNKHIVPAFNMLVADEYKKWVPLGVDYSIKLLAVTFAWWIQRFVSTVHSALRGGKLLSTSVFKYLHETGVIPLDPNTTMLDDYIGWALGAIGVYLQVSRAFALPFPLSFVFFPCTFLNAVLEWLVSS